MKLIKNTLAALVLLAATVANAQLGSPSKPVNTDNDSNWTNRIAGSSSYTNTTSTRYNVPSSATQLDVQISFKMAAGGATNQTIWIEKSVNGTDWVADRAVALAANATAGTASSTITNLSVQAPWYRFPVITNAFATGAHYLTNVTVTITPRPASR